MVEQDVETTVRDYLDAARRVGINAHRAVIFGSWARGTADEWSDIDLIVIAPELEAPADNQLVDRLWRLRARTDSRIEPIPCGEREWEQDDTRMILEVARREGIVVTC